MSVESTEALERSVLEGKDREQLLAIAAALGVKATSRAKKADIIAKILEQTGRPRRRQAPAPGGPRPQRQRQRPGQGARERQRGPRWSSDVAADAAVVAEPPAGAPPRRAAVETPRAAHGAAWPSGSSRIGADAPTADATDTSPAPAGETTAPSPAPANRQGSYPPSAEGSEGTGQSNRRRRRRNRDRNRGDGPQGADRAEPAAPQAQAQGGQEAFQGEPVAVAGFLDLRDEGYGFLRVNGYLPSRDDVYVSVKQTPPVRPAQGRPRHRHAAARPAATRRTRRCCASTPSTAWTPSRPATGPRFEDLTPLFPDEKLRLESAADPTNMTARIIDLDLADRQGPARPDRVAAEGGQDHDHEDDRHVDRAQQPRGASSWCCSSTSGPKRSPTCAARCKGEVIASTFDRPSDEHTHVAELAIERAKRMVEVGDDVVVILDGITRLARAYNLAAPATGRIMSGGIDAGALYPPKKFFGAARNIEEGGSLTILATALVETNSRMDDAIFEEFKGTGNMELRLDRKLAERRIYPAIDVDASSTRHEELLFDRKQLQMVWKLRRVLSGLAEGGSARPASSCSSTGSRRSAATTSSWPRSPSSVTRPW